MAGGELPGPRVLSWAHRFQVRQYLKGSLWFVPTIGGVIGPALALADLWLESRIHVPQALTYSTGSATGVLTAIVGAMVGLLGFVVTIGVLVVQTATGTLSPRFMRLWYRDPLQKAVLATFAGTFTFAFTLLRRVRAENVPNLGVTLAGALVTISLLMLLIYLDRFTHVLRPAAVGAIMMRYGSRVMEDAAPAAAVLLRDHPDTPVGTPDLVVRSARAGVVQALNADGLFAAAQRFDCVVVLVRTPGDFVSVGAPLMEVHGSGPVPDERTLTGMVALGTERTIDQDPAFAVRILVDIAIRALSPAVNDPTTAVQMLNHIETFLEALARRRLPSDTWTLGDQDGTARVVIPGRTFEDYLNLAVAEILAYAGTSPQVCRRLAAMFVSLADSVPTDDRPAVEAAHAALDTMIDRRFADVADREFARTPDRQGIGAPGRW